MASDAADFELTVERSFHGIDYIVTISTANNDKLRVDVEQKATGDMWHGEFLSEYIEESTHKMGNFKKFRVFVKMLYTSLAQKNESVFVDLLTPKDLEALKSRGRSSFSNQFASKGHQLNRYLILSYVATFDKVHYPLTLSFDDKPDPQRLKDIIRRLRLELEESRKIATETSPAEVETVRLKTENRNLAKEIEKLRLEKDTAENRAQTLATDLEQIQKDSHKQIKAIKKQFAAVSTELEEQSAQMASLSKTDPKHYKFLKKQVTKLKQDLEQEKQENITKGKQIIELKQRLSRLSRRNRMSSPAGSKRSPYGKPQEKRRSLTPSPSGSGKRSSSVPSKSFKRFDPTGYIKEKKRVTSRRRSLSRTSSRGSLRSRSSSAGRSGYSSEESVAKRKIKRTPVHHTKKRHTPTSSLRRRKRGGYSSESAGEISSRPRRKRPTPKRRLALYSSDENEESRLKRIESQKRQRRKRKATKYASDDSDFDLGKKDLALYQATAQISSIDQRLGQLSSMLDQHF